MAVRSSYFKATRADKTSTFEGQVHVKKAATFDSLLESKAGVIHSGRVAKNANYKTTASDYIVGVDTSGGAVTITLGSATVTEGRFVIIKDEKGNAGTNNITVATEGSETIDGSASITISSNYGAVILYSDGSNWFTI